MAISAGRVQIQSIGVVHPPILIPSKDKNARKNLDVMWEKFSHGGTALMPLDNIIQ